MTGSTLEPLLAPWRGSPPAWPRARRKRWLALIAAVALAHLLLIDNVVEDRLGWGEADKPPPRIEVTFVRELAQSAPPVAAAQPRPAPRAKPAAAPASAPVSEPAVPELPPRQAVEPPPPQPAPALAELPALVPPPVDVPMPSLPPIESPALMAGSAGSAEQAIPAASGASAAPTPVAAASAPDFAWPPSTRLDYRLEGYYRGRIEGSARVDWLRSGKHYQVHLETSLGPVLSRRITSDGELTDQGLAPRRFDGEQWVLFRGTRRWSQKFGPERITLADGSEVDALPGAQDEASQFVQLTWLFTNRPELLQVGRALVMPLALGRRVDKWIYDVVAEELLYLPFGKVPTFHLKPRREAPGGNLTPQIWIAPTLQYLPVRIRLNQGDENFVDLQLDNPPLQAER